MQAVCSPASMDERAFSTQNYLESTLHSCLGESGLGLSPKIPFKAAVKDWYAEKKRRQLASFYMLITKCTDHM